MLTIEEGGVRLENIVSFVSLGLNNILSQPDIYATALLFFIIYIVIKRKVSGYSVKREARKCESPIETSLFNALIKEGYQVYTQVPCGKYRIDMAIYIGKKKVAIEADGKSFHSSVKQVKHDKEKDWYLRKNRWEVIRFSGSDIYRNSYKCVEEIGIRFNG